MSDKTQKLLAVCSEQEKAELVIRNNAVITNLKAYNADPSAARKRDLDVAQKGLEELQLRLERQYFPDRQRFDTRHAVLKHLHDEGYKISGGKLHNDCKNGLLKVQSDGSLFLADVKAYCLNLKRRFGESGDKAAQDFQVKKAERELELLEIKIKRAQHEYEDMQGKYMPRDDFEREMAARAAIFDTGLRTFFRVRAAEIIALCMGAADTEEMVIDAFNALLDAQMNEFASLKQYHVLFQEQGERQ